MKKDKPRSTPRTVLSVVLRTAVIAVCGFFLYTFVFTMCLGQVNPGNIIGGIFCIAAILLAVFFPRLKRGTALRRTAIVCAAGLAVFTVYCAVISGLILSEMLHGEDRAAVTASADGGTPQTVIVLGCKTIDGVPSPMLELRLGKALEYLNSHPEAVCVVSGGQGGNEIEPEAVTMHRYLVSNGIDENRIYTEERSVNTTENIRFSAQIIEEQALPRDVVVVSECYHIFRGVRQARLAGLHAAGIYPDPSSVLITMPSYWVREIFAVSRDLFLG
ncbi:MAG: YdcF family protein [Ruminiclostridium sp.]|nr:YdcF family protein [Ruminiclostridium sp.]